MKSGPALKQLASHRAIHDAGQAQAESLTEELISSFQENRPDCLEIAQLLVTHWEEKVIPHADAEDEGLYQELLQDETIAPNQIYLLMRDHDLLRKITANVKETLSQEQRVTKQIIYAFHSLLTLNAIHHKDEEMMLFSN